MQVLTQGNRRSVGRKTIKTSRHRPGIPSNPINFYNETFQIFISWLIFSLKLSYTHFSHYTFFNACKGEKVTLLQIKMPTLLQLIDRSFITHSTNGFQIIQHYYCT